MDEIELKLSNDLPFCKVSKEFPEATFLRWCNSAVDYLEFYGDSRTLEEISENFPSVVDSLGSNIIFTARKGNQLSFMISCRCTRQNSTIRMTEWDSCLWQAPVEYSNGEERLKVVTLEPENFNKLFGELSSVGEVTIEKKTPVDPGTLRDVYTLSLSQLLGNLTSKQMHALSNAISSGYFSIPRKVEIGELAAFAGMSKSTMQEHLSKAVVKVLNALEPYIRLYMETSDANTNGTRDSQSGNS